MTNPTHYLVPAEPTEEMEDAADEPFCIEWKRSKKSSIDRYGIEAHGSSTFTRPMYAAMLAASPHAGQVSQEKFGKICEASGIDGEELMIVLEALGLQVEETG
jgi:hypothetical protein